MLIKHETIPLSRMPSCFDTFLSSACSLWALWGFCESGYAQFLVSLFVCWRFMCARAAFRSYHLLCYDAFCPLVVVKIKIRDRDLGPIYNAFYVVTWVRLTKHERAERPIWSILRSILADSGIVFLYPPQCNCMRWLVGKVIFVCAEWRKKLDWIK